jgi:hypothetical protein
MWWQLALDLPAGVPGWVSEWASAVAGWRFDPYGRMQPIPAAERFRSLEAPRAGNDAWAGLARWVATEPRKRTTHPESPNTNRQIAERERDVGTQASLESALRYDASVPLVRLLLAGFEENATRAAFLRDYDLKRLPDDAQLWFRAVRALADQKDSDRARGALKKLGDISPEQAQALTTELDAQDTRDEALMKTVDQFLRMLDSGQYEQSYNAASPSFHTAVTKTTYVDYMRQNRASLSKATDHQVKPMDTNTDPQTGAKTYVIPIASKIEKGDVTEIVTVVQDPDNQYRVSDYSLTIDWTGSKEVPNDITARQMVNNTMVNFKNAINSGNFEAFYRTQLSDRWKKETTPTELASAFQTFIDNKVDLSPIFSVQPVLDPAPTLDRNGKLILKGRYTVPKQRTARRDVGGVIAGANLNFELTYAMQAEWVLSRIDVNVKPIGE